MKKCSVCGREVDKPGNFCGQCGGKMVELPSFEKDEKEINSTEINSTEINSTEIYSKEVSPKKKEKKTLVVVILALVSALVIGVGVGFAILYFPFGERNEKDQRDRKVVTREETPAATETVTMAPTPEVTASPVPTTTPAADERYTEDELISAAKSYFYAVNGYLTKYVEVDQYNGDNAIIHFYDIGADMTHTLDWYTVNVNTGIGSDFEGNPINIMDLDSAVPKATMEPEEELEEESEVESDYIIPDSDKKYLTKADLKGLSKEECSRARNEIYARHGRRFMDEKLQEYFDSKSWYFGTIAPDDFKESMLNKYERENAKFILKYEKKKGYR